MPFDQTLVPWIIAAVLLVALIVVAVVLRARARRAVAAAKAAADEQARAAREQHEALAAAHDDALARTAAEHARERDALGAERQAALTEAKQARDLVAAGLKWEATSRDDIADACRQLGVDAVLLTNVVFVPVATSASSRFVAQVDHVLLSETGVMVIENKGWNGIVFDGLTPSSVFPAFAGLFDESTMTPPFALQVVKDSPTVLTVRTHLGRDAPASQVRRQAQRLSDRVQAEVGARVWFDTCVFYSHRDATVFATERDATDGGAATAIVSHRSQLAGVVRELTSRPTKKLSQARVADLAALFASYGADVLRFGAYAQEARVTPAASAQEASVESTPEAPAVGTPVAEARPTSAPDGQAPSAPDALRPDQTA